MTKTIIILTTLLLVLFASTIISVATTQLTRAQIIGPGEDCGDQPEFFDKTPTGT